jgi:L-threonylcarbamoyladenylate synthase
VSPFRLRLAARLLRRGAVVAYPTEAVYGLGCDPLNPAAVDRILAIKGRPVSKGLILIAAEFRQLAPFVEMLDEGSRMAEVLASWPGPHTWLLPAASGCPSWLTGQHDTLAVRVTAHPVAAGLCRAAGMSLVSTSANRSGQPPARTALQARRRCGSTLDLTVHGATGGLLRPTPIRDAATGALVRPS